MQNPVSGSFVGENYSLAQAFSFFLFCNNKETEIFLDPDSSKTNLLDTEPQSEHIF